MPKATRKKKLKEQDFKVGKQTTCDRLLLEYTSDFPTFHRKRS